MELPFTFIMAPELKVGDKIFHYKKMVAKASIPIYGWVIDEPEESESNSGTPRMQIKVDAFSSTGSHIGIVKLNMELDQKVVLLKGS